MAKTKNPELEQRRKAQITDTVVRLLVEGSHRSLTLDRVAREAGVSKGMVTYYFDSKDQLIVAAIERFLEEQQRALHTIVREPRPAAERLHRLIEVALPDREILEVQVQLQLEVLSFAKTNPEAADQVRRSYVQFRETCEEMIAVGIDEGYVTVADSRWIYLVLHALVDGMAMQLALDRSLDVTEARRRIFELVESLLGAAGS
ncbi:MAG: TetR/AcrR family transcriptional regulator [Deltaproteobacteria bacterium]|nr:TetR/AcrR family transcriptional regulator [Deltaproteobacteria bacterium]